MSQALEQKRAKYALDAVTKAKENDGEKKGEGYGRHVRKLPAMILNNGLGQALAFLLADAEGKKEKASWRLYEDLQTWLYGADDEDKPRRVYPAQDGLQSPLIDSLMSNDRSQYLQAQDEALKLLVWMKKFADAYLPKSGG